ncbi:hypothetical protein PVT67_12075 [Gallaecimonas kandeliae]|uniref:hypothetical protein n=1 Tax=Gallaecimonas kandeliae TaxID=3029055 RepID=UPI002647D0D5|nr:hypothetical protein [Gallaecimonas kandeliae]WKE64412.1 hypothetical protein PVT67_12075 [Gallaecimonas kandeliae]
MRIQSTPYQPSEQQPPQAVLPAASAEASQPSTELVRYSVKGVAAAEDYQVQYDAPSGRNQRAISQYQALDRQQRKAQASELLGVDLYV